MSSGKVLVAQGGGPTAVINQSLVGVVLEARRHHDVRRVYGARHGVRGIVNEDFVDLTQETSHNLELVAAHARVGAGLHARQARPRLLPGDLQGAAGARDRALLLHRRQRLVGHRAHRQRGGAQGRLPAALHPHPQDDRQRPGRQRPHAGLPVGGALRGPGLCRRQPRQRGAARRLRRRRHGPPRRLPDRGLGPGQEVPRRRPAPHLRARARLRDRQVPGRREGGVRHATAAA